MADEYAAVKRGKLVLKGEKPKAKKRKHKKRDKTEDNEVDNDAVNHGGWWTVSKIEDITGPISIEFGNNSYVSALDNGLFTIGAPHGDGEGPSPEEIFTAFPAGETKFALKSGYGKYLGVNKDGVVTGRSDAVGPMEQWEPVWQDGKTAILSSLNKFVSVNPEDDSLVVRSATAGELEVCAIRSNRSREETPSALPQEEEGDLNEVEVNYVVSISLSNKFVSVNPEDDSLVVRSTTAGELEVCAIRSNRSREETPSALPQEEEGDLNEVEVNYVKKFQKFQDKKMRINDGGVSELKKARVEGNLHETLLDRRSKMKADRYCK